MHGIDLPDDASAELIQERIDLLDKTGVPDEADADVAGAIRAVVDGMREKGGSATVDDFDPLEAQALPSPYDDPESGLRKWKEQNCDGVYTEEFAPPGEERAEDDIANQIWLQNQYYKDGRCSELPDLYTSSSDTFGLVRDCEASPDVEWTLIGGGVTGPDSAEALIRSNTGEEFTTSVEREEEVWKLTYY